MAALHETLVKPADFLRLRSTCKEFDMLELPNSDTSNIVLHRASDADIERFAAAARSKIGVLADVQTIKAVAHHNADNIHVIASQNATQPLGCFAQIMLRTAGLEALSEGRFNGLQPAAAHCARDGERPAGIYLWAVVAPGRAALGITLMSRFLRNGLYRASDLYTVPATEDGRRIIKSLGFTAVKDDRVLSLFIYRRLVNRALSQVA